MTRLYLGHIQEAGRTADQGSAGEVEFGDRLQTTLVQRSGTVCETFAIFEDVGKEWVVFHALAISFSRTSNWWILDPYCPTLKNGQLTWNSLNGLKVGFS